LKEFGQLGGNKWELGVEVEEKKKMDHFMEKSVSKNQPGRININFLSLENRSKKGIKSASLETTNRGAQDWETHRPIPPHFPQTKGRGATKTTKSKKSKRTKSTP
jgi:hypothetical protein